ncbi:hypothetical protein BH11MYX3_BH11MYX3_09430 [soil metagenome]
MRWPGLVVIAVGCGSSGTLPPDAVQLDVPPPADAPNGGLMMTPGSTDFGSVSLGTTSAGVTFTVSTLATTGVLTTSLAGTGASAFTISSDTCRGAPLPATSTCSIVVQFKPAAPGGTIAQLRVETPGAAVFADLSGQGLSGDDHNVVSPSMRDLGPVKIAMTSAPGQFTVTNVGGTTHSAITLAVGGTDASQFHVVTATDTCSGTSLGPAASCAFEVVFAPLDFGTKSATVTAVALSGGTTAVAVVGTGLAASPQLTVTPPWDFGSVPIGTHSTAKTFTVANTGGSSSGALTTSLAGTDATQLEVEAGSDHCAGTTLAPGDSCTLALTLFPTTVGPKQALLRVAGIAATAVDTQITGIAISDGQLDIVSPTSQAFGDVAVGTTSPPLAFTLSNQGSSTHGPVALSLVGSAPTQFAIVAATDTCTGASVAPGGSCGFQVTFTPTTVGSKVASVTVIAPGGNQVVVAVRGTGVISWSMR